VTRTHDYVHRYRGFWTDGGVCRVRVYQAPDRTPVVVCTELPENENTSVTNLAPYLAAELIAKHFPARFEHPEPVVWVEHYAGHAGFARVSFATWTPRRAVERGVARVKLGNPSWSSLSADELATLIGAEEVARV
jgi:hypothetical protein